jgi:hypothetical protein
MKPPPARGRSRERLKQTRLCCLRLLMFSLSVWRETPARRTRAPETRFIFRPLLSRRLACWRLRQSPVASCDHRHQLKGKYLRWDDTRQARGDLLRRSVSRGATPFTGEAVAARPTHIGRHTAGPARKLLSPPRPPPDIRGQHPAGVGSARKSRRKLIISTSALDAAAGVAQVHRLFRLFGVPALNHVGAPQDGSAAAIVRAAAAALLIAPGCGQSKSKMELGAAFCRRGQGSFKRLYGDGGESRQLTKQYITRGACARA